VELLLQTLVVAAVVTASAVFAAWRLMPGRTKLRVLDAIETNTSGVIGRRLARLRQGVVDELAHGCSACSKSSDHVKKHAPIGRH
jgi:hypothetical protein